VAVSRGQRIVKKHTRQLFSALASSAFASAAILPGCSGSDVSTTLSPGGGAGANSNGAASGLGRGGGSAGTVGRPAGAGGLASGGGNEDAGSNGLSECNGVAPQCRGTNLQECCGNDPYGPATCQNGKWLCSLFDSPAVPAPGCNSHICGGPFGEAGAGGEAGHAGAVN
jgi:hypothetical protein